MHDTLRLGRVAGIGVGVHWSVVGMGLLVTTVLAVGVLPVAFPEQGWPARWGASVFGAFIFGLSLLAHELGHAVVARRHQVPVDGITLWLLGGVARLTRQAPDPGAEWRIAAAGPLVSVALGLSLIAAAMTADRLDWAPLGRAVLLWVGLVNLVLAAFNLLPGAPLDGGRVLTAVLWRHTGEAERARVLAGRAGIVLGVLLVAAAAVEVLAWGRVAGLATAAIGVFLVSAARGEIASAVVRNRLQRVAMGSIMAPHPVGVPGSTTVERFSAWVGDGGDVVHPVLRWDHEPVGWVSAAQVGRCGQPESSWIRVEQVMVPDRAAPRAWASEPVDAVLARLAPDVPPVVVVLDPRTGHWAGTVGARQLEALFRTPGLWGSEPVTVS